MIDTPLLLLTGSGLTLSVADIFLYSLAGISLLIAFWGIAAVDKDPVRRLRILMAETAAVEAELAAVCAENARLIAELAKRSAYR